MSRGRPRHHGSRRRAYSGRQREVRERQVRVARHDEDAVVDDHAVFEIEPSPEADSGPWILRLQSRPTAA